MTGVTRVSMRATALAALALVLNAGATQAQSLAGVVRDTSGGVLPGVTVEASSPALIEKNALGGHRRPAGSTRSSTFAPAPTT